MSIENIMKTGTALLAFWTALLNLIRMIRTKEKRPKGLDARRIIPNNSVQTRNRMSQVFKSKCDYSDCQQHIEFGEECLNTMQVCPGCGRQIFLSVKPSRFLSGVKAIGQWLQPFITTKRVLVSVVVLGGIFLLVRIGR